jgi:hypothetical protein
MISCKIIDELKLLLQLKTKQPQWTYHKTLPKKPTCIDFLMSSICISQRDFKPITFILQINHSNL